MEDPATGSAACALGSYLALTGTGLEHGGQVANYQIVQGVEMGRESVIGVSIELEKHALENELVRERKIKNVTLSGSAVRVMEGKLWV
jgi:predicted PhzF superfamily epimerase YddE/YHI9